MTAPALVPQPTHLTITSGSLELTETTGVAAPAGVAGLLRELLTPATGLPLPDAAAPGPDVLSFALSTDPADAAELGDEGYRLSVADGGLRAVAATETGLLWAVQTLRQLLPPEAYAKKPVTGVSWVLPAVEITDVPRLPWRGALLDVARWCHPIAFVHDFVDQLAAHKMNTLHLHLTDDQGWRFEVKKHPRLTEVGGWRTESNAGHAFEGRFDGAPHGGFYTQEQLKDLVAYAARRGVRIMPEIDLPGHMQAAISAYPWLGNDPERQLPVRTAWGISSHVLNVADETLAFLRDILDEVVEVFPFEYVHLGGDEVPLDEWSAHPDALLRVEREGLAGPHELLGWWIKQMGAHLAGHGRRIAVWDELVEAAPPKDALVFAWRGADRVRVALDAGHAVVAVPVEYVYLDYAQTEHPDEPVAIGGPLPLERVYAFEPVPAGAESRVLGTQGMLWSEYTPTPELVEWRAHPRLSAIAEVAWSPAGGRDAAEFAGRLATQVRRLDQGGVRHDNLS